MFIKKEYTTVTGSNKVSNQILEIEEGSLILSFLMATHSILPYSKVFKTFFRQSQDRTPKIKAVLSLH